MTSGGAPETVVGSAIGAPAAAGPNGSGAAGGAGGASVGTAIAYPYPGFAGTPGIAPDHTIVVTGTGQATVKADLSDRAAAERTALDRAIADAKVQADAIAAAAGLSISGVLSVSASVGQSWIGPLPMGAVPGPETGPTTGNVAPAPSRLQPATMDLVVSVTVEYRIS